MVDITGNLIEDLNAKHHRLPEASGAKALKFLTKKHNLKRSELSKTVKRRQMTAGTDSVGSDIDLLVDALPGVTLFDLGGLQDELETIFSSSVDLLTPADLPAKFRAKGLLEAQPI